MGRTARVRLNVAVASLIFVTVTAVALGALFITYYFALDGLRSIGRDQSLVVHSQAVTTFSNYIHAPLKHIQLLQSAVARDNTAGGPRWKLPTDAPNETWHTQWFTMMEHIAIESNFSYSQILILLADNSLCRTLFVDNGTRTNLYCSRPSSLNPRNASFVEERITQFFNTNMTTPQSLLVVPYSKMLSRMVPSFDVAARITQNARWAYYYSELFTGSFPTDFILPVFGNLHNGSGTFLGVGSAIIGLRPLQAFLTSIMRPRNAEIFIVDDLGAIAATTYTASPWYNMTFPATLNYTAPLPGPWCRRSIPGVPNVEACRFFAKDMPFAPLRSAVMNPKLFTAPLPNRLFVAKTDNETETLFEVLDVDGRNWYATVSQKPAFEAQPFEKPDSDRSNIQFYAVLLVPEDVIIGDVITGRNVALAMTLALVVTMSVATAALVHALLRPLGALASDMRRAALLGDINTELRSRLTEVNELCHAFNFMNYQLQRVKAFVPQSLLKLETESTSSGESIGKGENQLTPAGTTSDSPPADANEESFPIGIGSANPLELSGRASSGTGISGLPHSQIRTMIVASPTMQSALNQFSTRRCTAVSVQLLGLPTDDAEAAAQVVQQQMSAVIGRAVQNGGVLETMTPELLLVTFNAHHSCMMHEDRAIEFSLSVLARADRNHTRVAIDTSDVLIGTCGIEDRKARVVLGECIDVVRKLNSLQQTYHDNMLVVTERTARGAQRRKFAIVDTIAPRWRQKGRSEQLHVCVVSSAERTRKIFTSEHRGAYSALIRGRPQEASDLWQRIPDWQSDAHIRRLVGLCAAALSGQQLGCASFVKTERNAWGEAVFELDETEQAPAVATAAPSPDEIRRHIDSAFKAEHKETTDDALFNIFGDAAHFDNSVSSNPILPTADTASSPLALDTRYIRDIRGMQWTLSADPFARGAFSEVYQGLSATGALAAVKVMRASSRTFDVTAIQNEVQVLVGLKHENIVPYVSIAVQNSEAVFIITELIAGGSLRDLIGRFGALDASIVRRFTVDTLKGLQYLHKNGVTHCDIKSQNVLLSTEGVCKLADFGSALNGATAFEGSWDALRGTSWYAAPEVCAGERPTPASDVWSLAITLLEMATGAVPWSVEQRSGNREAVFLQRMVQWTKGGPAMVPAVPETLPADLRSTVTRCLQLDPAARPTCADLLASEFVI